MSPAERNVVILGATGWVGRHLCELFDRRGYDVFAVARKPAPHVARHEFWPFDLAGADTETLTTLLRRARADVVVNATDAANATDGFSRTDEEFAHFHIRVVRRLVHAMADLPKPARLVHLGSILEYGPLPRGRLTHESVRPKPVGTYARTRLAGSRIVLAAARTGLVSGVVLRLVNVCGPYPSPATLPGKLLGLLRRAAVEGGQIELRIADASRDFVDVRDVARACLLAAEAPVTGQVINVGSGTAVALHELVELFVAAAGLPSATVRERTGDVAGLGGADWIKADIRLAAQLLSWRPRIGLSHSLRDTWEAE
jgi:NDP-hexose 4-ketoreductase